MRLGSALFVFSLSTALTTGSAFALGEGEASLAVGTGPALSFAGGTRAGLEVGGRLARGITDAWAGRLGVQSAWYPATANRSALHVTTQAIGVTWALDALSVVPFVDAGVLAADVRGGGNAASWYLGGELGGGLDYWLSRRVMTSLVAHVDYLPWRLAGAQRERPLQTTLLLLVARAF